eukprot:CAMPEP_0194028660 /NCGR_PEP_ID=MMETSP0009_2-20130614/2576_1 /TAXON_ID=210454 /ORGANISM="Grammatophora oceanica, Strain CCMP 410" /LENGTH=42 /DNA_ID= /DNA_START= /DNA_END= /DNA_ORIENTATION=
MTNVMSTTTTAAAAATAAQSFRRVLQVAAYRARDNSDHHATE